MYTRHFNIQDNELMQDPLFPALFKTNFTGNGDSDKYIKFGKEEGVQKYLSYWLGEFVSAELGQSGGSGKITQRFSKLIVYSAS